MWLANREEGGDRTAAAVSSQEVSIPRTFMGICAIKGEGIIPQAAHSDAL